MSPTSDILSDTSFTNLKLFNSFQEHCNGSRLDTRATLTTFLRTTYPTYHVTETDQNIVSLLEFAAAGKASLTPDTSSEAHYATRKWHSVGERLQKKLHPGALVDDYRFARFGYVWEEKNFMVYHAAWRDPFQAPASIFWILYPRVENGDGEGSNNVVEGHCKETDELVLACGKWTSQLHDEIWVFDDGRWDKSKDLWKSVNGASWEDVILDPEMKENLIEDVQGFFNNQELYSQFAVPWKRGIILHGVPGNGKTVSIKALMSSLYGHHDNIPSLYVKTLNSNCQTEQYSIRSIFLKARSTAPCLLIFEDLDSLVTDSIRSYFLNEVDGLESNDGILMIGSTNHLDRLDPAIAKRPSRFDRKYHYKLPGEAERTLYAEYWRKKLLKNNTVEYPEELCAIISKLTEGFSFAYLKELFVMSLLSLVRGFKGEDYEIVDPGDAPTPPSTDATAVTSDDTTTKPPLEPGTTTGETEPSTSTPSSHNETCTCAQTCPKCGKSIDSEAAKKKKDDEAVADDAAKKSKMAMPKVRVPDELEDNLLLKVVRHQIRVLHAEMDNTKEEQWPSGRKKFGGGEKAGRAKVMRTARARQVC